MRVVLGFALVICAWPCLAGNVYRCPDGSFQDKPCGGGGVVVAKNRPPLQAGADKACSDAAQRAEQIVKQKTQGVKLDALLDDIDTRSDSYEKKLAEKKFTVDAYKFESPAEAKVNVEAQCIDGKNKATAAAAGAVAQPSGNAVASVEKQTIAATDHDASERAVRERQCTQYKDDLASIKEQQRGKYSASWMDSLNKKQRALEKKIWDTCG